MSNDVQTSVVKKVCREYQIQLNASGSRTVLVENEEMPYPDGKLIVSRTDIRGVITHCNQSFVEMSGYPREELIGAKHNILRHPDMPALTFKGLWDDVMAGKVWHGYVKNLRGDGKFYWVYATVIPNVREGKVVGYTSVRRKPSRVKVRQSIVLYKQLKEQEGSSWKGTEA